MVFSSLLLQALPNHSCKTNSKPFWTTWSGTVTAMCTLLEPIFWVSQMSVNSTKISEVDTLNGGRINFGSLFRGYSPWLLGPLALRPVARKYMLLEENCSPQGRQETREWEGEGGGRKGKSPNIPFPIDMISSHSSHLLKGSIASQQHHPLETKLLTHEPIPYGKTQSQDQTQIPLLTPSTTSYKEKNLLRIFPCGTSQGKSCQGVRPRKLQVGSREKGGIVLSPGGHPDHTGHW